MCLSDDDDDHDDVNVYSQFNLRIDADDGGGDDVDVYLMQLDLWKHSLSVKIYFDSCFS